MPIIPIDHLDDPRVKLYRNLKDRELAREGTCFMAEGFFIVERLLRSTLNVQSILAVDSRLDEIMATVQSRDIDLFTAPKAVLDGIVGYKFHQGVLAIGERPRNPSIDQVMGQLVQDNPQQPVTLMILPETRNAENLGSLIRIASALEIDAVLLGPGCTDAWWRRTVRVSMGNVFFMPVIQSDDLHRDLVHLREQWQVQLFATTLDESAEALQAVSRPQPPLQNRMALLFGPEDHGLERSIIELCDRNITLPMHRGTDSLNVAMAAAVFCYHFADRSTSTGVPHQHD